MSSFRPTSDEIEPVESPVDEEADLGALLGEDFDDTLSAEEAAMRIVDEPPGANYDPTPGYLDDEE